MAIGLLICRRSSIFPMPANSCSPGTRHLPDAFSRDSAAIVNAALISAWATYPQSGHSKRFLNPLPYATHLQQCLDVVPRFHGLSADPVGRNGHMDRCSQIEIDPAGCTECGWMNVDPLSPPERFKPLNEDPDIGSRNNVIPVSPSFLPEHTWQITKYPVVGSPGLKNR